MLAHQQHCAKSTEGHSANASRAPGASQLLWALKCFILAKAACFKWRNARSWESILSIGHFHKMPPPPPFLLVFVLNPHTAEPVPKICSNYRLRQGKEELQRGELGPSPLMFSWPWNHKPFRMAQRWIDWGGTACHWSCFRVSSQKNIRGLN